MKKIFNLLLVTICCFGFISVVKAEEAWNSITSDVTFISDLIEGKDLTSNSAATEFFTKYDVYYKYEKIDDTLYANYVSDISKGTSTGAQASVSALVPSVSSVDELGSWVKATSPIFTYSDINYDSTKKTGYVVAIAAVDKADNTKIYVNRVVYEVTATNKIESSYEINCEDDTTTPATPSTPTDTATKENPNTGISDYAIYLVPIALIGGTVLMMRKNYA